MVKFFNLIDLLKEEDLKCDQDQNHHQLGGREKEEKTEDKDNTHHLHLQRTEDTDPDPHWTEEVAHHQTHPPEKPENLLLLTEQKHGRKGGLQSLSKFIILYSKRPLVLPSKSTPHNFLKELRHDILGHFFDGLKCWET